jgi:hypothetical protein
MSIKKIINLRKFLLYYSGLKLNFLLGVINRIAYFVVITNQWKDKALHSRVLKSLSIKLLELKPISVQNAKFQQDFQDTIIQLNFSKRKQEDVVNGRMHLLQFVLL